MVAFTTAGARAGSAFTNQQGTYTITGLKSGSYIVQFQSVLFGVDAPYASEYYNNQRTAATATTVQVSEPHTTGAINAQLERGATISGQVTGSDAPSVGLADVSVSLYDDNDRLVKSVGTDSNGRYTIDGINLGTYKLNFLPVTVRPSKAYFGDYYHNEPDATTATLITISVLSTHKTANEVLAKGGQIAGKVLTPNGNRLNNVAVQLYDDNGGVVLSTTTGADGTYLTPALTAGRYRVKFDTDDFSPDRVYLPQFYNGKADLASATPVVVTVPRVTANIDARLKLGGQIAGTVTARVTGKPLLDAHVTFYNAAGEAVASRTTGADGRYLSPGLPTGSYRVGFEPSSETVAVYAPQFYNDQPTLAAATPVPVTQPTTTPNINAQLQVGACITGKVTAADTGETLAAVTVTLYGRDGNVLQSTFTDGGGTYLFGGLQSGRYKIGFAPGATGTSKGYVGEYYHGKATLEMADLIAVTDGASIEHIDAALKRSVYLPLVEQ